jgi:hypothetical protein
LAPLGASGFGFQDHLVLASPLHEWFIQMTLGVSRAQGYNQQTDILKFCIDVIKRFSKKNITSRELLDSIMIQHPPAAVYQDEFYRCGSSLTNGGVIYTAVGSKNGCNNFYFPREEWCVRLVREGRDFQTLNSQFSLNSGGEAGIIQTKQYLILNIIQGEPQEKYLGKHLYS